METDNHVLYGSFESEYVTITRGDGVYVYDEDGNRYLDAVGGVCVVNIGHGVQEIVDAMNKQAAEVTYTYGGIVDNGPRQALAQKLQDWAPPGMGHTKSLFCSGGAEANEAALKLAYQYHRERGNPTKRKFIGRWQSYHGNTVATLSMSGRTPWRSVNSPLLLDFPHIPPPYCYRCPWDLNYPECGLTCANELQRVIRQEGAENIAAFIAEPVIGTSMSAVVPPDEYYGIIRNICDENDILFIADEVMSGVGRTGKKWAIEHWGVTPDIITSSKGLAGGYSPLGAMILAEKVWTAIADGSGKVSHSTTYGGNPLSCAVGLAVLEYIEQHDLVTKAGVMGDRLIAALEEAFADVPYVGDVRGKGLFAGVELVANRETKETFPVEWNVGHRVEADALKNGLLVLAGVTGLVDGVVGDHIELVPPYVIEDEHVEFIVSTLRNSILTVCANADPT
ncbi:MAG: aminotransferase class III-fold pyridoxal phosphate-dependent enzyme [Chloroflexi bacterium]|nr:aminotransferase class III-fold pyridoxal phosphate-dependent enzyme [Chloroflexota bacterium]